MLLPFAKVESVVLTFDWTKNGYRNTAVRDSLDPGTVISWV